MHLVHVKNGLKTSQISHDSDSVVVLAILIEVSIGHTLILFKLHNRRKLVLVNKVNKQMITNCLILLSPVLNHISISQL